MVPPPEESFRVPAEEEGVRLDAWLALRLGVPRARARRLVAQGAVSVDGRTAGAGAKGAALAAGAMVTVSGPAAAQDERPVAEPGLVLPVLAEGDDWIAVDKPAGMPVHPLAPGETGTALNAVAALRPGIVGVGEAGLRAGVVHRLDVDTSGVLVFATAEARWRALREAFAAHRVEKIYRAIVRGVLAGEGAEEVGLVVSRHRPARVRVVDPRRDARGRGARLARLRWRAIEALAGATLVEVRLETGHLHQVRATFAHLGHPLLGDRTYGGDEGSDAPDASRQRLHAGDAPRQMLHAARVACDDVRAESPDPDDFRASLARLRATR